MRFSRGSVALALLAAGVAGCGDRNSEQPSNIAGAEQPEMQPAIPSDDAAGWELLSSGEGTALRLARGDGAAIHLFCPALSGRLVVNVPGFDAIGSEERLSLGSEGTVVALVADSRGDPRRGGVTAEAPVPEELATIIAGPISASYGAQSVGPLASPSAADRAAFLSACRENAKPAPPPPPPATDGQTASACLMQDGKKLAAMRLRAIGTEPFWGARIEGRCVTYSTPEDQDGTRIWTRFSGSAEHGIWSGALDGRQFELRTTRQPGCSDGMSDNRYPIAVILRVRGETRRGCAEPA